MAAPGLLVVEAADQVVGSDVHDDPPPRLAVELLQVQPAYQDVLPDHAASIRFAAGTSNKLDRDDAAKAASVQIRQVIADHRSGKQIQSSGLPAGSKVN